MDFKKRKIKFLRWFKSSSLYLFQIIWTIIVYSNSHYVQQTNYQIPMSILFLSGFLSFSIVILLLYKWQFIEKENKLLSANMIKTTLLNSTLEGIIGINTNLEVYFMNNSAEILLDFKFNTPLLSLEELMTTSLASNTSHMTSLIKESLRSDQSYPNNSAFFFKTNGTSLPIVYSSSPILQNNEIIGAIIVFSDNTERLANDEKLKSLALYDTLTRIPNRFSAMSQLEQSIARAGRHQYQFSLCFIDINKFKSINDHYGHHIGDKALQHVANLISRIIRKNDFFGRLSGDEFCLILDNIYLKNDIDTVLNKIYNALKLPLIIEGNAIIITLSIGVITYTNEITPEELLIKADNAMYKMKKVKRKNACRQV